jgi:hypothetical protein
MKKILSKKRDLSPMEHSAKMDVVKQMRDMAASEMGGKLDGIKKVSVMSNDKEGLEKGLDKAKQILSSGEMEQMKNHAENDMGDDLAAQQEHEDDESNEDDGSEASFADGGEVQDPRQSAQDSMRKAFKFNEGGEVPESEEDESEESDESPEQEASEDDIESLDIDALKEKIKHLMALHKSMGSK